MALELKSLKKAIGALERSVTIVDTAAKVESLDDALQETIRAGIIQNFEVAYEQCWKFTQRWLRENRTPEDADHPRTRKELFRVAARHGLIEDPLPWFAYGDARNLTSHSYDEETAESVYQTAVQFIADAKLLLAKLEALND